MIIFSHVHGALCKTREMSTCKTIPLNQQDLLGAVMLKLFIYLFIFYISLMMLFVCDVSCFRSRPCLRSVFKSFLSNWVTKNGQPRYIAIYTRVCCVSPWCQADHFCSNFITASSLPLGHRATSMVMLKTFSRFTRTHKRLH